MRQYSPYVCLAYGRTVLLGNGYNDYSRVEEFLDDEVIDTEGLTAELRRVDTPYLILKQDTEMTEKPDKYGFNYVKSYGEYDLYLDEDAYLGTWTEFTDN